MNFNFHTPSVLNGFRKDLKDLCKNWERLIAEIGNITIRINHNYYDSYNTNSEIYECTLKDYYKECSSNETFDLQCTEMLLTKEMKKLFPVNRHNFPFIESSESEYFFSAFKGAFAPMHFDWDFCNVMLTQIMGRKRVLVFSPEIGKRLFPVSNTSIISFGTLERKEQVKILNENNGIEFIIEPGETLYIPKLWWHYVEYLDFGISINYRFGNSTIERRLLNLPRNHLLQTILHKLNILGDKELVHNTVGEILNAYYTDYRDGLERYKRMRTLYKRLYSEICPNYPQGDYIGDNFDLEITINKNNLVRQYGLNFDLEQAQKIIMENSESEILRAILNYYGFDESKKHKLNHAETCTIAHQLSLNK